MKGYKSPGGRSRHQCTGLSWLVLIGANADRAEIVRGPVPPDQDYVRGVFGLSSDVPVLIGAP